MRPRDTLGVSPGMRDPCTPRDVTVTASAPAPFADPALGVPVSARAFSDAPPRHRLVTIGDSLTHGFQSGAVHRTDLSYPAIVAHELGLGGSFRFPSYDGPGDGLPLNIESLVRHLERSFGSRIDVWEAPAALLSARGWLDDVEDYWERGPGSRLVPAPRINHNLGVYGWSLRQVLEITARRLQAEISPPGDQPLRQLVEDANARAGCRALASEGGMDLTPLGAARALGRDVGSGAGDADPEHGIETLVVMLGANEALGSVVSLDVTWSDGPCAGPVRGRRVTVASPTRFAADLARLVDEVRSIAARHVIFATVPHVTVAPLARGVEQRKIRAGSRYFAAYTYAWISDDDFDPSDPHLTHQQARSVDSAIDDYNDAIAAQVARARAEEERDWYLLDLAGLLDRLAHRRYITDPAARPPWWRAYPLPPELAAMRPGPPDSRFFSSDPSGRRAGGLFGLDGVHPTTIGYGILAQEVINVMSAAGVTFRDSAGAPRPPPVRVDFARLLELDRLNADPPSSTDSTVRLIGWIDQNLGFLRGLVG